MALNKQSSQKGQNAHNDSSAIPNDGTGIVLQDPYLEPFKDALRTRYSHAQKWLRTIDEKEGGLEKFSKVMPRASLLAADR